MPLVLRALMGSPGLCIHASPGSTRLPRAQVLYSTCCTTRPKARSQPRRFRITVPLSYRAAVGTPPPVLLLPTPE